MRITKVSVYTCRQPLKTPFTHASSGLVDHLVGVYVKLDTTDKEVSGIGEVRGNCGYFTGDTPGAVVAALTQIIAPTIIGMDPRNINELHLAVEGCMVGNHAAKAACDAAIYDLAARIAGMPVHAILGGKLRDFIMSEENIPFISIAEAEGAVETLLTSGCRFIKIRVGRPRFFDDLTLVKAVWRVILQKGLQDDVVLSCDANQAWETGDAIRNINRLAKYGVTIVEQPTSFSSITKLLELKRCIPIKLFADECAATIKDVTQLIELGAVDGIHIKLIKCGGIYNAIRLMHLAESHGLDYMIGGMDEGMLAVAAAVHLAAVAKTDLFEVHGHIRIMKDPSSGLETMGCAVKIPNGLGLGVAVDMSMLKLESCSE